MLAALLLVTVQLAGIAYAGSDSPVRQSIVVFPLAISDGIDTTKVKLVAQHSNDLFLLVNEGLSASKRFTVTAFDTRSASVQRGLKEQRFTEKEISNPVDTTPSGLARARKIAGAMGADLALIGSIDSYDYRDVTGDAKLTTTVQLVDITTGKIKNTVTVTGKGVQTPQSGQEEQGIGIAATYDAAEKLLVEVAAVSPDELTDNSGSSVPATDQISQEPQPRKRKMPVAAMIGALLLGVLVSSK